MIDSTIAFTLFDKLLAALGLIRDGQKKRTEKTDQALTALHNTILETKSYIHKREDGMPRDRSQEFSIAELWQKSSIPLREIDVELAEKCFLKSGYWMEPEIWNEGKIRSKGIAIDAVFEATRQLLLK